MQAAKYLEPGKIECRSDATPPEPAAGEVLIAVHSCGICGSDLHMYRNDSLRHLLVTKTPEGYDVPGHEFAGIITKLGAGVAGYNIGDRVVGIPSGGGGMGQLVRIPVNAFQLVKMPDAVSFQEAATTEPLADSMQIVRKAEIKATDNVLIFGVGIIGLGVIQVIKAQKISARRIIAVDIQDVRLQKALELGATHTINPLNGAVFDQVAAICGRNTHYAGEDASIDVVIDCAGYIAHLNSPAPLQEALRLVVPNTGRIICFGAYEGIVTLDLEYLISKQPTIMGSMGYAPSELSGALELMRSGKVDRNTLMSHQFWLDKVQDAFEAQTKPDAVKVIINIPQDELAPA
jgi:(R,R)-butanediol dehydrogenase/meso-butanediol dehydrogenase/diacetyl reductase